MKNRLFFSGPRRLFNAMRYSWAGLRAAWHHEEAFRQETLLCLVLIPVAFWLGDGGIERALLVGSLLLVVIVELLNSGVEALVDRVGTELHELSRRAKDMSSAAVFMSLLNATLIWVILIFDF